MPLFVIALMVLIAAGPARADFTNALSAYDAGAYGVAATEWRRLAEHGDLESQVALAGLYEAGLGVPQDFRKAAQWYAVAAKRGHVVARLNLGDIYSRGRGVVRDPVEAWYWLSLAAASGSSWARDRRDEVASGMSPEQLTRAKALLAASEAKR